jgi:Mrr N-terminal domain
MEARDPLNSQIDVDDDVLNVLKQHAEPFVDTPNSVLRRLLGIDQTQSSEQRAAGTTTARPVQPRRAARSTPRRQRAAAGSLLPEERYELPLLRALIDLGGRAPYRDVMEAVGKQLEDELTPLDKDTLKSGGIRWQNRLQFVRLRLIERGLLDRDSPRGVWGITDNGRAAVKEERTQ